MFEKLELISADTILGLMAAFRADPDPRKVDLGVGVFRDDRGETPVLECVRTAEQALIAEQTTKTYVGPTGNAGFNAEMERLVFGADHPARQGRPRAHRAGPRRLRRAAPRRGADPRGRPGCGGAREHADLGEPRAADLRQRPEAGALSVLRRRHRRGPVRGHDGDAGEAAAARRACCCTPPATTRPGPTCRRINGARCWSWSSAARCCPSSTWPTRGWARGRMRMPSRSACSAPSCRSCCARCRARRTSGCTANAPARCTSSTRAPRPGMPR